MITYQIVVEADNTARQIIRFEDLDGQTFAAPDVSVLSQGFINDYLIQSGLPDIPSVLTDIGAVSALSDQDVQDMTNCPIMATPPGSTTQAVSYSSDDNSGTGTTTSDPSTALQPIDTLFSGALADTPIPATPVTPPVRP